jgi:hypothetical protein
VQWAVGRRKSQCDLLWHSDNKHAHLGPPPQWNDIMHEDGTLLNGQSRWCKSSVGSLRLPYLLIGDEHLPQPYATHKANLNSLVSDGVIGTKRRRIYHSECYCSTWYRSDHWGRLYNQKTMVTLKQKSKCTATIINKGCQHYASRVHGEWDPWRWQDKTVWVCWPPGRNEPCWFSCLADEKLTSYKVGEVP